MTGETQNPLKLNLEFYIANQDKLVSEYNGKTLLIHNQQVIGAFDSAAEAFYAGKAQFEPGTFSVQNCAPGVCSYTEKRRGIRLFQVRKCVIDSLEESFVTDGEIWESLAKR